MRVMIVDDSMAMRMIVKRGLRQAGIRGIEVCEAENGIEAIARARDWIPELVLCDWNMPEMDGITLLHQLREFGYEGRFGFVTSTPSAENKSAARLAGADFIIGKPFTPQLLADALQDGSKVTGVAGQHRMDSVSVMELLRGLLNRRTTVKRVSNSRPIRRRDLRAVATFVDSNGELAAVALADHKLAIGAAAALSMMPQVAVEEALKGDVSPQMAGNLQEVFNVFGRLLSVQARHVRLEKLVLGVVDRETAKLVRSCKDQLVLDVEISGYGAGLLGLYANARLQAPA